MTPTPTPTPVGLSNAQSDITTAFGSTLGVTEVLVVVVFVAAVVLIIPYAASSLDRYERLRRAVKGVARAVVLAFWGVVGMGVIGVVAAPAYFVASQPAATRTEWLTYGGYALAAFVGLAAFGWVVEGVVAALLNRHAEFAEDRDGPDPEAVADGGEQAE